MKKVISNRQKEGIKGKTVVVMGLGLHGGGVAAATWAAKQGARVIVTDLRSRLELTRSLARLRKYTKITYILGKHRVKDFSSADLIIKNPGVPPDSRYLQAARQAGVPIENDASIFFRHSSSPVIAVTGTKGKSTTTLLIHALLRAARKKPILAGNIRISTFDILDQTRPSRPAVLELSSWQIEDAGHARIRPAIAVMTNILRDHLNRHGTMRRYVRAKAGLFRDQEPTDIAVLNYDNAYTRALGTQVTSQRVWFSRRDISGQNAVFVKNNLIVERLNGRERILARLRDWRLLGEHNIENILAACAAVSSYQISTTVILRVARSFREPTGRLELIKRTKEFSFYNDTTATMPAATVAALRVFPRTVVLIAGGTDKKLDYTELVKQILRRCSYVVLLPGSATQRIISGLRKNAFTRYVQVESMDQAVQAAIAQARKTEVGTVLLSPGAASFGLFVHEFDRGDAFVKAVKKHT